MKLNRFLIQNINLVIAWIILAGSYHSCFALNATTPRFWMSGEYLYWWVKNSPIDVPLITENNNPMALGIITEPGTKIIFGQGSNINTFNFGAFNGGRITVGGWIDPCYTFGLEASSFGLSKQKSSYSASSVNNRVTINVPFYSTQSSFFSTQPTENVLINRLPTTINVSNTMQPSSFQLSGLYNLKDKIQFPLVFILGMRYININEDLNLTASIYNTPLVPNSIVNVEDNFSTKNDFYGIQLGGRSHFTYCHLIFDTSITVAIGKIYQTLVVDGQTTINNRVIIQPIGLFSEPTISGTHRNNEFGLLPELSLKIGYEINRYICPYFAYNFIYLNNIIQPGKQIDRNINQSQNPLLGGTGVLSGAAAPVAKFNNSNLWMQGVSAGIQFNLY